MWSNRLKRILTAVWKYRSAYDIILEQDPDSGDPIYECDTLKITVSKKKEVKEKDKEKEATEPLMPGNNEKKENE